MTDNLREDAEAALTELVEQALERHPMDELRGLILREADTIRAALAAAPHPAPAPADERAAMIEVIRKALGEHMSTYLSDQIEIAIDALLTAGWTRGGDAAGLRAAAQLGLDMARANDLYHTAETIQEALARPSAPETLAWGVVGENGEIELVYVGQNRRELAEMIAENTEGKAVRVAIRVVEGGDDE